MGDKAESAIETIWLGFVCGQDLDRAEGWLVILLVKPAKQTKP
jgi:hypothetical protein